MTTIDTAAQTTIDTAAHAAAETVTKVADTAAGIALSERVVSDWDSVRADLEILRGLILNRQDAILNLTAAAGPG